MERLWALLKDIKIGEWAAIISGIVTVVGIGSVPFTNYYKIQSNIAILQTVQAKQEEAFAKHERDDAARMQQILLLLKDRR